MPNATPSKARSMLARLNPFTRPMQRKDFGDTPLAFAARTFMMAPGQAIWMERDYVRFSQEAYVRNVIAHRAIAMVAGAAASVGTKAFAVNARTGARRELRAHPLLSLLAQPNPAQNAHSFMSAIYHHRLISGNAFLQAAGPADAPPQELYILRPDRISIIAGKGGIPASYRYTINGAITDFRIDPISWRSRILHVKSFHPLNDWYGLSPVEAAAYSIDQHNMAGAWNQALLQNGARPSGALVVTVDGQHSGMLSEEQYGRIKRQIDEQFSGPANAGRPLLLEGGLDWKELSLSPKDMDFLQTKQAAARDIALAFGVPPQLLGIPGDNTYANLQEARLALWEQTVLPLVADTLDALGRWLEDFYGATLELKADIANIPALVARNQLVWGMVQNASFLTDDEKRAAVGYGPLPASQSKGFKYSPDQPRDGHGRWTAEGDDTGPFDNGTSADAGVPANDGTGAGSGQFLAGQLGSPNSIPQGGTQVADSSGKIVGTTPGGVGYDTKIKNDMSSRNWTSEQIDDAKAYGDNIDAINRTGNPNTPATRYVNPNTGKSVVIDNTTNSVVQVGKENFIHSAESGDAPGAVMRSAVTAKPSGGGGAGGSLEPLGKPADFTSPRPGLPEIDD